MPRPPPTRKPTRDAEICSWLRHPRTDRWIDVPRTRRARRPDRAECSAGMLPDKSRASFSLLGGAGSTRGTRQANVRSSGRTGLLLLAPDRRHGDSDPGQHV